MSVKVRHIQRIVDIVVSIAPSLLVLCVRLGLYPSFPFRGVTPMSTKLMEIEIVRWLGL